MMKVNNVVITIRYGKNMSHWSIPFTTKKEANKYADKLRKYWNKRVNYDNGERCLVTVQQAMPIRTEVGKDWRKANIK